MLYTLRSSGARAFWTPPEKAKDKLGITILGNRASRLISAEVKTPDDKLAAKSIYRNHTKIGDSHIPMEVTSTLYVPKSEVREYERVIYSNPQLNTHPRFFSLRFRNL